MSHKELEVLDLILEAFLSQCFPSSPTKSAVFIFIVISAVQLSLVEIIRCQTFLCKSSNYTIYFGEIFSYCVKRKAWTIILTLGLV